MKDLEAIAVALIQNKQVCFSCPQAETDGQLAVSIRECEDYDFVEYETEYEPGTMFEVGPAKGPPPVLYVATPFKDLQEAGNAVLAQRAEILGISWGDAQPAVQADGPASGGSAA